MARKKLSREERKEQLKKRMDESAARKGDSGKYRSIFKSDLEDVDFWKATPGDHIIDIIPYYAGATDPIAKEGEWAYVLDLWVHRAVGAGENNFVCPKRNFKERCPVCEHQAQMIHQDDFDEDLLNSLEPKRRVVYNIVCYDSNEEEDKGVQVWETAHWFMEDKLIPISQDRHGNKIFFPDEEEGKSIAFTIEKSSFKDKGTGERRPSYKYVGHRFENRDYSIDEGALNAAYTLDEIIHIPSREELHEEFWGEPFKEGETPSSPPAKQAEETEKETRPPRRPRRNEDKKEEPATSASSECPDGHEFGKSIDGQDSCNTCDIYDDCAVKAAQLKEEEKKEEKGEGAGTGRSGRRRRRSG